MGEAPLFKKTYNLKNCEVVGFCRLVNLKEDQYGRKKYILSVLIDKTIAQDILSDANQALDKLKEKFPTKAIVPFTKIGDTIYISKDKKEKCPKDKAVLELTTDSSSGEYLINMYDAQNNLLPDGISLSAGSIINVYFQLVSYTTSNAGLSLKLQALQTVKAVKYNKNTMKESPFDALENADELEDEFVDDFSDDEDAEEI